MPDGEPTYISQKARAYRGTTLEQFMHLGWKDFVHPDDWEETSKAFLSLSTSGSPAKPFTGFAARMGSIAGF